MVQYLASVVYGGCAILAMSCLVLASVFTYGNKRV